MFFWLLRRSSHTATAMPAALTAIRGWLWTEVVASALSIVLAPQVVPVRLAK